MTLYDPNGNPVQNSAERELVNFLQQMHFEIQRLQRYMQLLSSQQIVLGGILDFLREKLAENDILHLDEAELVEHLRTVHETLQEQAEKAQAMSDTSELLNEDSDEGN